MTYEASPSAVVAIATDREATAEVVETLSKAGHAVHVATEGVAGVALVHELNPLVTIVQADLPDIDGSEVARRIREFGSTYLILFSEDVEEIDVILALAAGADDYLSLPLRPRELRARINAMLRRPRTVESLTTFGTLPSSDSPASSGSTDPAGATATDPAGTAATDPAGATATGPAGTAATGPAGTSAVGSAGRTLVRTPRTAVRAEARGHAREQVLVHNGLELVVSARTLSVDGETVNLTRSEFDLLAVLLAAPRRVISKDELARALWSGSGLSGGEVTEADRRTIEVHVANLRRKIGENRLQARFIETVRGVGYRLTPTTTN